MTYSINRGHFFEIKIVHDLALRKCVILLKICGLGEKENPEMFSFQGFTNFEVF